MKKIKPAALVSCLAAVAWMGVIFAFSAQDATRSQQSSDGVLYSLLSAFGELFEDFSVETLSFIVRKCAHFSAFFVLGVLFANAVSKFVSDMFHIWALSFDACVLYAASDEIHQFFIEGRACRLFDICVDSAGSLAGVLAVCLVIFLIRRHAAKKTPSSEEHSGAFS